MVFLRTRMLISSSEEADFSALSTRTHHDFHDIPTHFWIASLSPLPGRLTGSATEVIESGHVGT
jgi:hypothetical protein